jgi:hypothetical protein
MHVSSTHSLPSQKEEIILIEFVNNRLRYIRHMLIYQLHDAQLFINIEIALSLNKKEPTI